MPEPGPNGRSTTSRSYHGQFRYVVDAGRRVMIPKSWRPDDRVTQFVALLWPIQPSDPSDVHLVMLPPEEWQARLAKMKEANLTDSEAAQMERSIAVRSAQLYLDKVWRFCLPAELADGAGVSKEALFVGRLRLFEIWSPERYRPELLENQSVAARTAINFRL
jgi:division/cell wall cluster transcriptional repressor MraZ